MSSRPPKPRPVRVVNSTGWPLALDSKGRSIAPGETRDSDANDPVTALYIRNRYFHVLQEN